jgi:hypothetical protein
MSDNPKSKGQKVVTKEDKPVDMKRLLNMGVDVSLSFGEFKVKELSVFSLMEAVAEGLDFFVSVLDEETTNELDMIKKIVSNKNIQTQFCKIVAASCGSPDIDLFKTMKTSDLLKVIKALKQVIDFEEIKETFFELGLQKYLTSQTPISTET